MKLKRAKEFLKIEWRKAIVFIVISVLISLLPIYPCDLEIHGIAPREYSEKKLVPIYMGIFSGITGEDILDYEECGIKDFVWWGSCKCDYLLVLPFFLIVIIPSYLLSCLIIWIYEKVKKK